jgi:hypothetical protein
MYTLYKINTDELNEKFISAIKAQFPHQTIEIAISDLAQQQDDETSYLLKDPENKIRLLAAIKNVEQQQYINVEIDSL